MNGKIEGVDKDFDEASRKLVRCKFSGRIPFHHSKCIKSYLT